MATVRPMTWSVASHTSPMPPIAIREIELVAAAEGHTLCRSHLLSTASMTFFAIGAAIVLPLPDCP